MLGDPSRAAKHPIFAKIKLKLNYKNVTYDMISKIISS